MQQALIIGLVTGTYIPPLRLDLMKTLFHPRYNHLGCNDPDCIELACVGNRVSLVAGVQNSDWEFFGYTTTGIEISIVHGKNDRRAVRDAYRVRFTIPDGDLLKLLLTHVKGGRSLLTLEQAEPPMHLFVTDGGNSFNNSTFTQYWEKAMKSAQPFGIKYFPPCKGWSWVGNRAPIQR